MTPEDIMRDLNAMLTELGDNDGPNTIILPYGTWVHWRAMQIFGQRVNRANRHKFRRVKLAVMAGL